MFCKHDNRQSDARRCVRHCLAQLRCVFLEVPNGSYSACADPQSLLNCATRMRHWPKEIRLAHGEERVKRELAEILWWRYRERDKDVSVMLWPDRQAYCRNKFIHEPRRGAWQTEKPQKIEIIVDA